MLRSFLFSLSYILVFLNSAHGTDVCSKKGVLFVSSGKPIKVATADTFDQNAKKAFDDLITKSATKTEQDQVYVAFGTDLTGKSIEELQLILEAHEKEGRYYSDIEVLFPVLSSFGKQVLRDRFDIENLPNFQGPQILTNMLSSLKAVRGVSADKFSQLTPEQKLDLILKYENPFAVLNKDFKDDLFENGILNFNKDGQPILSKKSGDNHPFKLIDELGGWEVILERGLANEKDYRNAIELLRKTLGEPGHQHLIFAIPRDLKARQQIAAGLSEMVRAVSLMTLWHQMKRNPEEVDSILWHEYLGIQKEATILKMMEGLNSEQLKIVSDKFVTVSFRKIPVRADDPAQAHLDGYLVTIEIRSGNKGPLANMVKAMIKSRLITGDFSGLKNPKDVRLDPATPTRDLLNGLVSEKDLREFEKFESEATFMKGSSALATGKFRDKVMLPLLNWTDYIPVGYTRADLLQWQTEFAHQMVVIARNHNAQWAKLVAQGANTHAKSELNDKTKQKVALSVYRFALKARLDFYLQKYLMPKASELPSVLVKPSGPIDVNHIGMGKENSFRFPPGQEPQSVQEAIVKIKQVANILSASLGGSTPVLKSQGDSHGHGISVKYTFKDSKGRLWRVEWDGIQRRYGKNGNVLEAWGGHVEIPNPKMTPIEYQQVVEPLFNSLAMLGYYGSRTAGGAHDNRDVSWIKQLPEAEGVQKITNLITYFETRRALILAMFMHPGRERAASSPLMNAEILRNIQNSRTWQELAEALYRAGYFNKGEGRKPKYVPLNLIALIMDAVPEKFIKQYVDIKNPTQKWRPDFGAATDRAEARFFDAATDAVESNLQVKYFSALLDHVWNHRGDIYAQQVFRPEQVLEWAENPEAFIRDLESHLSELGLNVQEFMPMVSSSYSNFKSGFDRDYKDVKESTEYSEKN